MESSNLNKIYDPIRKEWVQETPEEIIRQKWLQVMVKELGYPAAFLAVEKELRQLPHLRLAKNLPKRRIDIVAYAKGIEQPFFPLLLMECKATSLNPLFARQVMGYNSFVGAFFVALANEKKVLTGHFDESVGHFTFTEGLPSYETLFKSLKKNAPRPLAEPHLAQPLAP